MTTTSMLQLTMPASLLVGTVKLLLFTAAYNCLEQTRPDGETRHYKRKR